MAQAVFWINKESVFNFDGKDYRYGDKLPASVDAAPFIKKGKASYTAPSAPAAALDEVEVLRGQIAQLTAELAAANQTIEQLTASALTPGVAPTGAGPKEGKK
jgi:hypothetical protein